MRCGLVQYVLLVLQISWWEVDYACYVPYATLWLACSGRLKGRGGEVHFLSTFETQA